MKRNEYSPEKPEQVPLLPQKKGQKHHDMKSEILAKRIVMIERTGCKSPRLYCGAPVEEITDQPVDCDQGRRADETIKKPSNRPRLLIHPNDKRENQQEFGKT